MLCTIWYHLYKLKNVKNTQGGVLLLVNLLKVILLHGCFSRFLICANGTEPRKASHMIKFAFNDLATVKQLLVLKILQSYATLNTSASPYPLTLKECILILCVAEHCYFIHLLFLKSLVTIKMNEIFPCLACYGQKLNFFVRKSRQR